MVVWEPKARDFHRVYAEQNPWHFLRTVPGSLAPPVERRLAQLLWRQLHGGAPRRYSVVLGPRRVGKTTVLYQTVRHLLDQDVEPHRIWWLRMDHPLLMSVDLGELVRAVIPPDATFEHPAYVMLDEIVYADKWDLWLKTFFDEQWPVRVAATSSATAALRERRTESGVGRWSEHHLLPYSFAEFLELVADDNLGGAGLRGQVEPGPTLGETLRALPHGLHPLRDRAGMLLAFIFIGGFPELLVQSGRELYKVSGAGRGRDEIGIPASLTPPGAEGDSEESEFFVDLLLNSQRILRNDAVERAIYKDIPQSFGVNDPLMLERLLYVLASQMAGLLSPSGICSDLGLSQPTFDRYLSYLERAFLVFTLPNYSGTEVAVQRRGRKLYFVDGAVRNAALQRGLSPLDDAVEQGLLFENLVASSLHTLAQHSDVRLYHWREGKHEVDLVFDDPNDPVAFEIASSSGHHRTGLIEFAARHPRFRGCCYLVAPQAPVTHPNRSGDDIGTLPLETFLLAAGAQSQLALDQTFGAA